MDGTLRKTLQSQKRGENDGCISVGKSEASKGGEKLKGVDVWGCLSV